MSVKTKVTTLQDLLRTRVVILDGAYATMAPKDDSAALSLHRAYIDAGADVIKTGTFLIKTDGDVVETYRHPAELARVAADAAGRPCFVAGALGPVHGEAAKAADPAWAYAAAAEALMAGGADFVLLETMFDCRIVRAAVAGIGSAIPVMISATVERNGRLPSGETVADFWAAAASAAPLAVGLNCGFGAAAMTESVRVLAELARVPVSAHPNVGIPDAVGPAEFADIVAGWAKDGLVSLAGGCCGTTPAHIAALVAALKRSD